MTNHKSTVKNVIMIKEMLSSLEKQILGAYIRVKNKKCYVHNNNLYSSHDFKHKIGTIDNGCASIQRGSSGKRSVKRKSRQMYEKTMRKTVPNVEPDLGYESEINEPKKNNNGSRNANHLNSSNGSNFPNGPKSNSPNGSSQNSPNSSNGSNPNSPNGSNGPKSNSPNGSNGSAQNSPNAPNKNINSMSGLTSTNQKSMKNANSNQNTIGSRTSNNSSMENTEKKDTDDFSP